ncbi:hypothetical protein F994_02768 [Acinetobacter bohemicus ANC 3994]|uniref:Uncharacterized protein n=1 Tax=Acinetobacter bohemicus ANC 3994 TaxID=1217715 RepID=N8NW93_9GAMM|nr:hypothetical protein [Acinetobacter bohemicus]ENU18641.1 hypothetical protein F994_02768 [Acinetobacter bohemicus ANC 3994]
MSNYWDDTIETAIASDKVWANTLVLTNEVAKATATIIFILGVLTTEHAVATDSVFGYRGFSVTESAQIQDQAFSIKHGTDLTVEVAKAKDKVFAGFHDLIIEQATAIDTDRSLIGSMVYESAHASDLDLSKRLVAYTVQEKARLSDTAFAYQISLITETVAINDSLYSQLKAFSLVSEVATVKDYDLSALATQNFVIESGQVKDGVYGALHAHGMVVEIALVTDHVFSEQLHGQAWTANTDTWAMSRYAPFSFEGVSVINGELYTWNKDGVYLSGIEGESISAKIQTGKLDFGEALVHPTAAYLEYQMSGTEKAMHIAVTTTQSGLSATYQYLLPKEQSDYLTNGRIIFGRGLRGRHFSFEVALNATSAQINALSIEHTKTARRT